MLGVGEIMKPKKGRGPFSHGVSSLVGERESKQRYIHIINVVSAINNRVM